MRKICLIFAAPATCNACGRKIKIAHIGILVAILPLMLAIAVSAFADLFVLKAALWIDGLIMTSIVQMVCVPLVPR